MCHWFIDIGGMYSNQMGPIQEAHFVTSHKQCSYKLSKLHIVNMDPCWDSFVGKTKVKEAKRGAKYQQEVKFRLSVTHS